MSSTRQSAQQSSLHFLERFGVPLLMVLMIIGFSVDPSIGAVFRGGENLRIILGSQAVTGLIALSMLCPLVAGYFDLSVASIAGTSGIVVAAAMGPHHWPVAVAILASIAVGAAIGFANGFLVARLRLNGFVVTLGTYILLGGILQLYTKGNAILNGIPESFSSWGSAKWIGLPRAFVLLMVVGLLVWYLLTHVPYGRYLAAIGSNESAARLVGINTNRVVWTSFVISGTLAAVAGVLQTSVIGAGNPTAGASFLFPALTAVLLSATMLHSGRYNVWGTILGAYFLAVAVSGFTLLGADVWVTPTFNGIALIAAVTMSTLLLRSRERNTLSQQSDVGSTDAGAATLSASSDEDRGGMRSALNNASTPRVVSTQQEEST